MHPLHIYHGEAKRWLFRGFTIVWQDDVLFIIWPEDEVGNGSSHQVMTAIRDRALYPNTILTTCDLDIMNSRATIILRYSPRVGTDLPVPSFSHGRCTSAQALNTRRYSFSIECAASHHTSKEVVRLNYFPRRSVMDCNTAFADTGRCFLIQSVLSVTRLLETKYVATWVTGLTRMTVYRRCTPTPIPAA